MSKEMWIAAFDQLMEEYLENHPDATFDEAYKHVGDNYKAVDQRLADNLADMIDYERLKRKEG